MDRYLQRMLLAGTVGAVLLVGSATTHDPSAAQEDVPRLETRLYGQSAWLAGSPASLRVVTLDHRTGEPVPDARVEIALRRDGGAKTGDRQEAGGSGPVSSPPSPVRLYSGRTNDLGTVDAAFPVPDWDPGGYRLTVTAAALGERDAIERTVTLRAGEQVLLTTDKPLYQPGQTIHIRALALRQPDQRPLASTPATLEVEDAKGNKVFKRQAATSAYGILSADFVLANEVNQGRYTIRALAGQARQEKTVTVERYVLPKFRVTLTPERKFYQPGQVLSARVESGYFFGKPVARARVVVTLSKFDAGFEEFARIEGHLDEEGGFTLQQPLPTYFVGQPLEQGNAFVKYDVAVTDTADHTEKISGTVPVAAQPMKITVVPEGGRLVPNVENVIYILATYPDGSPAKARLTITAANTRLGDALATDAAGIAEWRVTPRQFRLALRVAAVDDAGSRADTDVNLTGERRPDGLILRADRALYTVGDTMQLSVVAPGGAGTIYFDLVRAGQTILTRSAPLRAGGAALPISLSPDAAGTLQAHAYRIQPDGQIVRDTRVVFVDPGTALSIQVKPDKETYLPGAPAKLTLQVRPTATGAATTQPP
ncbi:MAG: hypothetical protein HY321_00130, partial [Armatimonadetes bacterium]|nr:hypothetical protein [Armatimonadota bacterium]